MTTATSNAIVALGVAIIGVCGSIGGIYLGFKLNQVHTLVNATHTALGNRIEQLEQVLLAAGIDVPVSTRETGKN